MKVEYTTGGAENRHNCRKLFAVSTKVEYVYLEIPHPTDVNISYNHVQGCS